MQTPFGSNWVIDQTSTKPRCRAEQHSTPIVPALNDVSVSLCFRTLLHGFAPITGNAETPPHSRLGQDSAPGHACPLPSPQNCTFGARPARLNFWSSTQFGVTSVSWRNSESRRWWRWPSRRWRRGLHQGSAPACCPRRPSASSWQALWASRCPPRRTPAGSAP